MNKTKMMTAVAVAAMTLGALAGPHGGGGPGGGPRGGGGRGGGARGGAPARVHPAPAPRGGGGHHGGIHHAPPPRGGGHHGGGHHHHGGGSLWGRGGRNFWPGVVGGVVGGVLYDAVRPAPVVVAPPPVVVAPTPVVTPAPTVWVEGRYVDQYQPNGTVIRVWQPGHYETPTVW